MVFFPTRAKYFDEKDVENIYLETKDGIKIHCYYIKSKKNFGPLLLSFHGNAENANMGIDFARNHVKNGISVILADYRGYGKCEGEPSEKGTYIDAETYYDFALSKNKHEKIIIHGRSLGGAVAVKLASEKRCAGLILESTFTTAEEVFGMPENILKAKYRSIDIIDKIKVPTLFIHGESDTLVPFWMCGKLMKKIKAPAELFSVEPAGHNDLIMFAREKYFQTIKDFILKVT